MGPPWSSRTTPSIAVPGCSRNVIASGLAARSMRWRTSRKKPGATAVSVTNPCRGSGPSSKRPSASLLLARPSSRPGARGSARSAVERSDATRTVAAASAAPSASVSTAPRSVCAGARRCTPTSSQPPWISTVRDQSAWPGCSAHSSTSRSFAPVTGRAKVPSSITGASTASASSSAGSRERSNTRAPTAGSPSCVSSRPWMPAPPILANAAARAAARSSREEVAIAVGFGVAAAVAPAPAGGAGSAPHPASADASSAMAAGRSRRRAAGGSGITACG